MSEGELLSAEVVLRAAAGFDPTEPITAANVADAVPDPRLVRRVQRHFERLGFAVGPEGPLSFSITAPPARFNAALAASEDGHHFDLTDAPRYVRDGVDAIVTTPPPDFGPTRP